MLIRRLTVTAFFALAYTAVPPLARAAVIVSTAGELAEAVRQANSGGDKTIVLRDGVYTLDEMLWISAAGVSVSSQSGNRDAVVVQGQGMSGAVTHVFNVAGSGFTAKNMTLRNVSQHAIQLQVDVDSVLIQNLHILDTGEQMVKIPYDPSNMALRCDDGVMERCLLEYSAGIGPQWYIGGIDAHNARNWVVRDNTFVGIRSPADATAEHAIHFWSSSQGTLVERNTIINCDRGIGFGLGDRGHSGGTIRNNMIYHDASEGFADVGIALESAPGAEVYNNTIFQQHSYQNAIEYRFASTTGVLIANNLANRAIASRDGASGTVSHNVTSAGAGWFVNASSGDLHLATPVAAVVDQGRTISGLVSDFDRDSRPQGTGIDIGADEYTTGGGGECRLACPADVTVTDTDGDGAESVSFDRPTSTGDCGEIATSPPSGSLFPQGETTVICTSARGGGSCSFTVTVLVQGSEPLEVSSCRPSRVRRGRTVAMTVHGDGFQDGAVVVLGKGIGLGGRTVRSPQEIGLTATVGRKAKTGLRDVAVRNPDGQRAVCRRCLLVR